ncbi:hypothetical protein K8Z49_20910 [Actinomadura madurae]|uniref:hypothetical protein n=1 Tax=Actinomadura madurae TaxID=1993 RepID=UPI00399B4369
MSATQALLTLLGLAMSISIPPCVFTYFKTRASERRDREEQAAARDALANALPYYRRVELAYIRLRLESPDTQAARDAHSASFRVRSSAHMALVGVRLYYTDPRILMLAQRAFDLTGEIHYAKTMEQAAEDALKSAQALLHFVTATNATVHALTPSTGIHR